MRPWPTVPVPGKSLTCRYALREELRRGSVSDEAAFAARKNEQDNWMQQCTALIQRNEEHTKEWEGLCTPSDSSADAALGPSEPSSETSVSSVDSQGQETSVLSRWTRSVMNYWTSSTA